LLLYCHSTTFEQLTIRPGHIKPGTTRTLISGEDVAATFMEIGGGAIPKTVSGRSFYPLLMGQPYQPREYIFGAPPPASWEQQVRTRDESVHIRLIALRAQQPLEADLQPHATDGILARG
jgi:arylsulfatase A-like enzyme